MLTLHLINRNFKTLAEKKSLLELKTNFRSIQKQPKWKNLCGTLNLILFDNAEIQKLNFAYRQKNLATDVLSFPYYSLGEIQKNQDKSLVIGEIFLSFEKIKENAVAYRTTFKKELNKIFIHGFLHILGYDHIDDNDFLVMEKMEKFLFKSLSENKNCE